MYAASVSRLKATTLHDFLMQGGDVAACSHIMPHCKDREALHLALKTEAKARGLNVPTVPYKTLFWSVSTVKLVAPWISPVVIRSVPKGRVKVERTTEEFELEFAVKSAMLWIDQVAVLEALWPTRDEIASHSVLYWVKGEVRAQSFNGRGWVDTLQDHPEYAACISAYERLEKFKQLALADLDGRQGWKINAKGQILVEAFKGVTMVGMPAMKLRLTSRNCSKEVVDAVSRVDVWKDGEIVDVALVAKLMLLDHFTIRLDQLIANRALRMVVAVDPEDGKLKPLSCPLTEEGVGSHYLSLEYAPASVGNYSKGMVVPFAPLQNVATFEDGTIKSFLGPKKYLARQEKLVGKSGIQVVLPEVWVVLNGTTKTMRQAMVCGNIYTPTKVLNTYGCGRLVGDNHNGLIKGVNSWTRFLDAALDNRGISLASGGCVKGGLDLIQQLGSDKWVTTETEMIAGESYQVAKLKDVVLTMTNSFTVTDGYTFRDRNGYINTFSDVQIARYEAKLTQANLVDGDPLLLELVMNLSLKLKSEGNSFPLVNALEKLTKLGIIKVKPAMTEIVHSELDMMVNEYGPAFTEGLMNSVVHNGLNNHKVQEYQAVQEYLTENYNLDNSFSINYKDLIKSVFEIVNGDHGMTSAVLSKTMFNRDMVVDLLNAISPVDTQWIHIRFANDEVVTIPGGKMLEGGMMETNANYSWIQAEGFFPRLLKHLVYTFDMFDVKNQMYKGTVAAEANTARALSKEVQMYLLGKKLGRFTAPGFYGALVVSPFKEDDTWYCSGVKDSVQYMLATKHPVLIKGSTSCVIVSKNNPYWGNMVAQQESLEARVVVRKVAENMSVIFNQTVFAPAQWFLGTQNDGDGDQVRMLYSDYITAEHTQIVVCPVRTEGYFARQFHVDYVHKELKALDMKASNKLVEYSLMDLAVAAKDAAEAKRNVGVFTKVLQRALNFAPHKRSDYACDLLFAAGTLTQIEAMNGQKQATKGEGDLFLSPLMTIGSLKKEHMFDSRALESLIETVSGVFEANHFNFEKYGKTVEQAAGDYLYLMVQTSKRFTTAEVDLGFLMFEDQNPMTMLPAEELRTLHINPKATPAMLWHMVWADLGPSLAR